MTGFVQAKSGKYYVVLNFYDENGKRKPKWISTGLPERGVKLPRIDTFVDIANCLHVSADALLIGLVDEAKVNQVNELAARILSLPKKKQASVLRTIETLLDL